MAEDSVTLESLYRKFREHDESQRRLVERSMPAVHLRQEHIQNCELVLNRTELLKRLPSSAVVAEIGVDHGDFSEAILSIARPKKLYLVDIWGTERYHDGLYELVRAKFSEEIANERVVITRDLSVNAASTFPDAHLDWIYIDTDHSYSTTKRELEAYARTIKAGGIIAGHDYSKGNMINGYRYGVIEAVHEFCLGHYWQLLYLTIDYPEVPSFAIRKVSDRA
jgi:hypothetical protein